ncbi:MAG: hypothetical protein GX591_11180 [Planctomycetes bacterium]|nr:hypothetical protein [Planctomycetota bacterium]
MRSVVCLAAAALVLAFSPVVADAATSVTQYGITWTFDRDCVVGQFVTGDWWVVGPVTIIGISTDLHDPAFAPGLHDDGSMVNPGGTGQQGYDGSLTSYRSNLNAALPNGQRVSPANPLVLPAGSSLVSMVSWLYTSSTNKEPGCPSFNAGTGAPRPVTRSGAVLTVLAAPAPEGSFRPPYCGSDKTVKFNVNDLDLGALKNLAPVTGTPDPAAQAAKVRRPWVDHVHEYLGAMVHPSANMPQYGRDMAKVAADVALLLNIDFAQLPGSPDKRDLLIPFVQLGIDLAGIADIGGGWPPNGGHQCGRKLPILVAGLALNDPHMLGAGQWTTDFQDDMQTFYVSQAEVDMTHSPAWDPDDRADLEPYEVTDIGMPEWGIRHATRPSADNRAWGATYRAVNGAVIPSTALAAAIMNLRDDWNHEAYFDYAIRYMTVTSGGGTGTNAPSNFAKALWTAYADTTILAPASQPGDADGDGDVDLDDFAALKNHFGTAAGATTAQGDFDGDGDVDLDDFAILKNNFGATAG